MRRLRTADGYNATFYPAVNAATITPRGSTLLRPCPKCDAQPGHACRRSNGRNYEATVALKKPHDERRRHRTPTQDLHRVGLRVEPRASLKDARGS